MSIAREPMPHQGPTRGMGGRQAARAADIGRAYLHRLASRYQLLGRQRGG